MPEHRELRTWLIGHMGMIAALIFAATFVFAVANGYWIYLSIISTTILAIGGLHLALTYQNVIGCIFAVVMVTAGMIALCMAIVFAPVDDLYEIALGGTRDGRPLRALDADPNVELGGYPVSAFAAMTIGSRVSGAERSWNRPRAMDGRE